MMACLLSVTMEDRPLIVFLSYLQASEKQKNGFWTETYVLIQKVVGCDRSYPVTVKA